MGDRFRGYAVVVIIIVIKDIFKVAETVKTVARTTVVVIVKRSL